MSDVMISVENLSKRYRIGAKEERYKTLREAIVDGFKAPIRNFARLRKLTKFNDTPNKQPNPKLQAPCSMPSSKNDDTIWAVKDVSFEVKQGEVLGIIGRNGAGKTTLLKILSRITEPSSGDAKLYGRVSSLLEVGTGFHPELTGRENVFLNGTILGMRRAEIDCKFDEIVEFSGVEKFIDTPVKRYSSGMQVRLAFAVAAHLEPEILLIDEVLAVGDMEFQKKCLGKMKDVAGEGRTVLFVSHNMSAINNLCQKAIVLSEGKLVFEGKTPDAISEYLSQTEVYNKHDGIVHFMSKPDKLIQMMQISTTDKNGNIKGLFEYRENPVVNIDFNLRESNLDYYTVLSIFDNYGNMIYFTADDDLSDSAIAGLRPGQYRYQVQLPGKLLKPGKYYITVSLTQHGGRGAHDRRQNVLELEILDNNTRRGMKDGYRRPAMVAPELNWELGQSQVPNLESKSN